MKTTKDAHFREHPEWQQRANISGCIKFDGEDYDEKVKENQIKKEQELLEEKQFAQQQEQLNEMRFKLEKDHNQKRKNVTLAEKETDSLLYKEKKDKEFEEKQRRLEEERKDLELCKQRAQKLNGKVGWQGMTQVLTKTQASQPDMTQTKVLY